MSTVRNKQESGSSSLPPRKRAIARYMCSNDTSGMDEHTPTNWYCTAEASTSTPDDAANSASTNIPMDKPKPYMSLYKQIAKACEHLRRDKTVTTNDVLLTLVDLVEYVQIVPGQTRRTITDFAQDFEEEYTEYKRAIDFNTTSPADDETNYITSTTLNFISRNLWILSDTNFLEESVSGWFLLTPRMYDRLFTYDVDEFIPILEKFVGVVKSDTDKENLEILKETWAEYKQEHPDIYKILSGSLPNKRQNDGKGIRINPGKRRIIYDSDLYDLLTRLSVA